MRKRLDLTPDAIALVATRFKVLSEPFRLRIIQTLETSERSIGELAEQLGSSQPNVSKHVRVLQEAGLVGRRQEGNTVHCSIADPTVFDLCDVVRSSLRRRVTKQAQSLPAARRTRRSQLSDRAPSRRKAGPGRLDRP